MADCPRDPTGKLSPSFQWIEGFNNRFRKSERTIHFSPPNQGEDDMGILDPLGRHLENVVG